MSLPDARASTREESVFRGILAVLFSTALGMSAYYRRKADQAGDPFVLRSTVMLYSWVAGEFGRSATIRFIPRVPSVHTFRANCGTHIARGKARVSRQLLQKEG